MKKRYINGAEMPWLKSIDAAVWYDQELKSHISHVHIEEIHFTVPVDYEGSQAPLLEKGSHVVYYVPDDHHWALCAVYNRQLEITEWYVDIIKGKGEDEKGLYIEDLYLDFAVSPEREITFLDEKELLEAKDQGLITSDEVRLAYDAAAYVKAHVLTDELLLEQTLLQQIRSSYR